MRALFALSLLLISYCSFSQDTIPYFIDNEEYLVYAGMDEERKSEFLSAIDAVELEIAPFTDVSFPVRIMREDGSQNLMRYGEVEFIHKKDLESIDFFTFSSHHAGVTTGKNRGKQKIIFEDSYSQKKNKKKDSWDEILWKNQEWFKQAMKNMEIGEYDGDAPIPEFYVKNNGLWGVIGIIDKDVIQVMVPTIYENKKDITSQNWPFNHVPDFDKIRKKFKVDLIEPFKETDMSYHVRDRKNHKWGVVRQTNDYELIVDTKYDSITALEQQEILVLWEDNYVGISSDMGEIHYPPMFDDFKMIHLDYMWGVALKSENEWVLYRIDENKKLLDESAESTDQLLENWLNR